MNSRGSVNESNLVNIPTDLSNLNQLTQKRKEPLLSFPFDHLYACHSESSQRRQIVELDKEVEISTHCVVSEDKRSALSPNSELGRLTDQLSVVESQNRKLRDLLVYHLDLIQQQNDTLTKKDKLYQALQIENETLKHKLNPTDKKPSSNSKQTVTSQSLLNVDLPSVSSIVVKEEPKTSPQIMFDSLSELLLPENRNPYIFNSEDSKDRVFNQESFDVPRTADADLANYLPTDLDLPSMSLLDSNINCDNFTMIESKPPLTSAEVKTETRPEPLYTVTTNSGTPIIQKIQRNRRSTSGGLGSLSRMPKRNTVPESSQILRDDKKIERTFSLNKKCKTINTYGKSRTGNMKRISQFTGSLSDRLRLIDTTPTGEDPYQLGEADMREQSPIPKLMLQKSSHRHRTCTSTSTGSSIMTTRRIYDPAVTESVTAVTNKPPIETIYNLPSTYLHSSEIKTEPPLDLMSEEPALDIVKTEPGLHWSMYTSTKAGNETSLCDFSYGENTNNLASNLLSDLDGMDFPDFFTSDSPLNLDNITPVDFSATVESKTAEKTKKRAARTTSLMGPNVGGEPTDSKRCGESKRGRKRALSATGPSKATKRDASQKGAGPKPKIPKGKAATRGKKSPVPGMMTRNSYHTLMGDPDLSWYLGLDPDVKPEDIDPPGMNKASTVEVPRWREKPYTSCYTLEGTENLNDKVFEKRHHKLEADERRQLRWHMRRIREQRHVERLRQRQRDPWCGIPYQTHPQPSVYTIWPQPQRDIRVIEITDTLPVVAFGEHLPELPEADFMLPWVRTSKALKRSKRSKTLH